jgi:hypothetical protein
MAIGFEKLDGSIITEAWFNGYAFGERLLEGVMFKAVISDGQLKIVTVQAVHPDVMSVPYDA